MAVAHEAQASSAAGSPKVRDAALAPSCELRFQFAERMAAMYSTEVPAYKTLLEILKASNTSHNHHNRGALSDDMELARFLKPSHGAIRVGTATELQSLRRLFAIYGMYPVDFYDLVPAGIPVHATAFRPVSAQALKACPFRLFCSLLRSDLIGKAELRRDVDALLSARQIFPNALEDMLVRAEDEGGVRTDDAEAFLTLTCEVFRWRPEARVDRKSYEQLRAEHPLLADIAAFSGPHINHLTPQTLDIDEFQTKLEASELDAKPRIEGPPRRHVPILLRQTAFNALREPVTFNDYDGNVGLATEGYHRARFGEVEQRGVALTPTGRALFDSCLGSGATSAADLTAAFRSFPDSVETLVEKHLAYFRFFISRGADAAALKTRDLGKAQDRAAALRDGLIRAEPIIYEDFLPVSAAGIFRSNLDDTGALEAGGVSNRAAFEKSLGCAVIDSDKLYWEIEQRSLEDLVSHI